MHFSRNSASSCFLVFFFLFSLLLNQAVLADPLPDLAVREIKRFFSGRSPDLMGEKGEQVRSVGILKRVLVRTDLGTVKMDDAVYCAFHAYLGDSAKVPACPREDVLHSLKAVFEVVPTEGVKRERDEPSVREQSAKKSRPRKSKVFSTKKTEVPVPPTIKTTLKVSARTAAKKRSKTASEEWANTSNATIFSLYQGSPLRLSLEKTLEWDERVRAKRAFLANEVSNLKAKRRLGMETALNIQNSLLERMPDYSQFKDTLAGTFEYVPLDHNLRGTYSYVYLGVLRHPIQGAPSNEMIALKVMSKEKLDRSIAMMLFMKDRTPYIPEILGMSWGRHFGPSDPKRPIWIEVEGIRTGSQELSKSLVFELILGEISFRQAGVCVGDWKEGNIGRVSANFDRIYKLGPRLFHIPAENLLPKRLDPGLVYPLREIMEGRGLFRTVSDPLCEIPLEDLSLDNSEFASHLQETWKEVQAGRFTQALSDRFLAQFSEYEVKSEWTEYERILNNKGISFKFYDLGLK